MSDLSQQLVTAIQAKSLANVQEILSVTHDSTLFAITTPVLHHAIENIDIFSLLIKRKFNFAVKDNKGHTVLARVILNHKQQHAQDLVDAMIKNDGYEAVYNEFSIIKKQFASIETSIMATHGLLNLITWCHEHNKPFDKDAMNHAAAANHLTTVIWLHENRTDGCTNNAMDIAALQGYYDMVKWLHEHYKTCTSDAMNWAAEHGHLDVCKFLHENRTEGCTTKAIDYAAANGHLDVIKFLIENRTEGCTCAAMDCAAENGYVNIVKYLHEYGKTCSQNAMDSAARNGHLDVVKFLHENRTEGCTCGALNQASLNGHLDVVKYLLEICPFLQFSIALNNAAMNGYLDIVKYIVEYMIQEKSLCTSYIDDAIDNARNRQQHIVEYLTSVRPQDPVEKIEQEYFDELSLTVYDNFVKNNDVVVNHAEAIIKKLLRINDTDSIFTLLALPRYDNINAVYIMAFIDLLVKKNSKDIAKLFNMPCIDKVYEGFLINTALNIENYDLIKQISKKYKDETIDAIAQLPKEKLIKCLTHVLN